jgi:hypothetical protein
MPDRYIATWRDNTGVVVQEMPAAESIKNLEQAREWMQDYCERKGWEYLGVEKA